MIVCITGGSGFIGSYFYRALQDRGIGISILDLVAPTWDTKGNRVTIGDIRDTDALREAMNGADACLHLAAAHHDFGINHDEYFSVNEGGAKALCAALDEHGIKTVCFYSSVAVYGNAPEPRTVASIPEPFSPYGQSKLAAERVFHDWTKQDASRNCLIIRPTVTFGPGNYANMYSLIRQIHRRKFFPVGKGLNIKSLSYVENIVDATLYLWNLGNSPRFSKEADGCDTYNYIDKPDLNSHEIIDICYQTMNRRPPRFHMPLWLAILGGLPFDLIIKITGKNLPISTARIHKLCQQTKFEADKIAQCGFKAKVPLTDGIKRMVQWYLREGQHQAAHAGKSTQ